MSYIVEQYSNDTEIITVWHRSKSNLVINPFQTPEYDERVTAQDSVEHDTSQTPQMTSSPVLVHVPACQDNIYQCLPSTPVDLTMCHYQLIRPIWSSLCHCWQSPRRVPTTRSQSRWNSPVCSRLRLRHWDQCLPTEPELPRRVSYFGTLAGAEWSKVLNLW